MSYASILYFLFWAGAFALMMRFGCGAHVMGHGRGHEGHPSDLSSGSHDMSGMVAPETTVDPVCGMTIRTSEAKSLLHEGHAYYFCSQTCREKFEAAPDGFATRVNPTLLT